jgi:multiple sugar transport system ATP-binding protein
MSSISLTNLTKRFGDLVAVNALDLEIKDKEFVALLGPSGCGKTTTMNMIAGIEQPNAGVIRFDKRDVTRMPMGKREVGFVFQNYAIFLHMPVYKNLAFGLEVAGLPRAEIDRQVTEMARLMRLTRQINWPAQRLSVNELQRVAIGRSAIVKPNIFLLDEPLSNLDAAFRAEMRIELKHFQHELKQTMVYVTHDQLEAMSMADRIAVMDQGLLHQYGTPLDIYNRPVNAFVARFIGAPSMNLMRGTIADEKGVTKLKLGEAGTLALAGDDPLVELCRRAKSREILFGVRPEDVLLGPANGGGADGVQMSVTFVERIGPRSIVHLEAPGHTACVVGDSQLAAAIGDIAGLATTGRTHLFDAASGERVE